MVTKLATGEIQNSHDGAVWLRERHDILRSPNWLRGVLREEWLRGEYRAYRHKMEARRVVDETGLFSDLDINDSGHRRYRFHKADGLTFAVHYTDGTHAMSSATIDAAIARVERAVGRPEKHPYKRDEVLLPARIVRCSVCGSAVEENPPREPNGIVWSLRCRCVRDLRAKKRWATADAREWVEANQPHVLRIYGRVSRPIQELVRREFLANPRLPQTPGFDVALENTSAQARLFDARTAFDQFQQRAFDGLFGDLTEPHVAESVQGQRKKLLTELKDAEQAFAALDSKRLEATRRAVEYEEMARILRAFLREDANSERWRDILDRIVHHVEVDLAQGTGRLYLRLPFPGLEGATVQLETKSSSGFAVVFPFSVRA